jgi:peptide/nickel transport system ATP-binding protein
MPIEDHHTAPAGPVPPAPPHPPVPPLLDVRDLAIRFGAVEAVRGLSFSVTRGETLALVGESGCGKSATALSLLRLLPRGGEVSAGTIRFDGQDVHKLPDAALRRLRGGDISMIFQEPMSSLNPVLTIGSQIVEAIREHERLSRRSARRKAIELMDLVRIPEPHRRIDEYQHVLSGGMRQRVMIAIAVACQPRLLIADEPTTALDVTIQAQILELLDGLRRQLAMSLLLITHDLGVVADWADRVVVMYAGRVCEEARTELLFRDPRHPYTRGLMACSPRLGRSPHYRDGRLPEIAGSITSATGVAGCAFAARCPSAILTCRSQRPDARPIADTDHVLACPVFERATSDGGDVAFS